jgi:hypothetical protein
MVRITPLLPVLAGFFGLCAPLLHAAEEIPFRLVNGFIIFEGHVDGTSDRLALLLDSGASVSVLNDQCARQLGVQLGRRQTVRGVHSEARARAVRDLRVVANSVDCGEIALATDLSAADELCGEPIDALIGTDFFRDRVVEIDFAARRIRCMRDMPNVGGDAVEVPLRIKDGVLCAPVGVNESTKRWVRVDTGCNEPLHWVVPRRGRERDRDGGLGRSIGFVSRAEDSVLVSLSLGSRIFPRTEAVLHGRHLFPAESGLLGTGILAEFRSVIFDWPGQALTLVKVE